MERGNDDEEGLCTACVGAGLGWCTPRLHAPGLCATRLYAAGSIWSWLVRRGLRLGRGESPAMRFDRSGG